VCDTRWVWEEEGGATARGVVEAALPDGADLPGGRRHDLLQGRQVAGRVRPELGGGPAPPPASGVRGHRDGRRDLVTDSPRVGSKSYSGGAAQPRGRIPAGKGPPAGGMARGGRPGRCTAWGGPPLCCTGRGAPPPGLVRGKGEPPDAEAHTRPHSNLPPPPDPPDTHCDPTRTTLLQAATNIHTHLEAWVEGGDCVRGSVPPRYSAPRPTASPAVASSTAARLSSRLPPVIGARGRGRTSNPTFQQNPSPPPSPLPPHSRGAPGRMRWRPAAQARSRTAA